MFNLNELLDIEKIKGEMKIHLATGSEDEYEALKQFEGGSFQEWQGWQNQKNFSRKYLLSLILMKTDVWLFAGIYEILDCNEKDADKGYIYQTQLTDYGKNFIGRLQIFFMKKFRNSYPLFETVFDDMRFHAILEEKRGYQYFPGAKNILIGFRELKTILDNGNEEWHAGLSQLRAVYLITDAKTGRKYVGSATGKESVWSRWKDYVKDGTGKNERLIDLIKEKGMDYCGNFVFSILEVFGDDNSRMDIVRIEHLWMDKLMTRGGFGYN